MDRCSIGPAIGRLHQAAAAVTMLGTVMVGLGAILETSVARMTRESLVDGRAVMDTARVAPERA